MPDTPLILVVDDSATQRAILEDALRDHGYSVVTATNGAEALSLVYSLPPSLVISDILMPELNGYHLCRLLKNDPLTSHIPVILLSNLKERHDQFWGEKAGADLFLGKTPGTQNLLTEVEKLLARRPSQIRKGFSKPSALINFQSQLTTILDKLLFESTISNEILKLTRLAHDPDLLATELFSFLDTICRFNIASLLLYDGREKYSLCISPAIEISSECVSWIKSETLGAAGFYGSENIHIRTRLQKRENILQDHPRDDFKTICSLPIRDQGELLAQILLFDKNEMSFTESTKNALNVIAERFLIVVRFLKNIKEVEDIKADFISMLVHDLRSPLTGIRGFTTVLSEGLYGPVNEGQARALNNIESGCNRLLTLIEDILNLSKLDAGKMSVNPSPVHLESLVKIVTTDMLPLIREKDLRLSLHFTETHPFVMADENQLSRVITNLFNNAIKFTPPGGEIEIAARWPARRGVQELTHYIQVNIVDSGKGILVDQQELLFGRYQQVSASSIIPKGTGLGLAICREIISLHSGEIWIESPVGPHGGSRFCFTLPLPN